ncbi:NAD-dependent epimerase/dehydratase family protein [Kitasatospora sp. MAP5-34]|uniref:NAD-dependent epimerase/dehydratase family protein n=1 Tax=Kitasatospora sp. MAP5-34 TaxID=3035102 RepID=UPI0024751422|nr:NAD-dependent epimerase/dehydratase family protein [Kitasatospora sp. MAP5-34]MDH6578652.1 UDP-N-acetylglucosamine 4-epimerase [Kitasatospora sp. MAP5-34]
MSTFQLSPRHRATLPDTWLVTGVAGFIGSHLLETLLGADRRVVGLDNFVTGTTANLEDVRARVLPEQWDRFRLVEGDLRSLENCRDAVQDVDVVLHQAALNSVPRSLLEPDKVIDVNIGGSANLFRAAGDAGVSRVVYASSSSVYGDVSTVTRREDVLGNAMSPYAVSKRAMEQLAAVYQGIYGIPMTGLRYFNVFGPRQNPDGPYSAVIPRWIRTLLAGDAPVIYGDGTQSRDFTYVENVVLANLLAATRPAQGPGAPATFNVGTGHGTSIRELFTLLRGALADHHADVAAIEAQSAPPRQGDVASALADLGAVGEALAYRPVVGFDEGLQRTVSWFGGALVGQGG